MAKLISLSLFSTDRNNIMAPSLGARARVRPQQGLVWKLKMLQVE